MKLRVALNGTDVNPYERLGLTHNPFPQLATVEHSAACIALQKLGGPPIPREQSKAFIREALRGHFADDFIELIASRYAPGMIVRFEIDFPPPTR